ncbi:MAG: polysaccharide deacetylase family protein [Candidatus Woesearchaeota archaeon]
MNNKLFKIWKTKNQVHPLHEQYQEQPEEKEFQESAQESAAQKVQTYTTEAKEKRHYELEEQIQKYDREQYNKREPWNPNIRNNDNKEQWIQNNVQINITPKTEAHTMTTTTYVFSYPASVGVFEEIEKVPKNNTAGWSLEDCVENTKPGFFETLSRKIKKSLIIGLASLFLTYTGLQEYNPLESIPRKEKRTITSTSTVVQNSAKQQVHGFTLQEYPTIQDKSSTSWGTSLSQNTNTYNREKTISKKHEEITEKQGEHENTPNQRPTLLEKAVLEPATVSTLAPLLVPKHHTPVLMYHHIRNHDNDRFSVSPATFRQQLKTLYEKGYQTISIEAYVNNDFSSLLPGKKPVVITFDDGWENQFRYLYQNGKKIIDPTCAVGILDAFAKEYPQFGKAATFFISYDKIPFGKADEVKEKFTYLLNNGYSIQNHTANHKRLDKLSREQIEQEYLSAKKKTETYLDSTLLKQYPATMRIVAIPYGANVPQTIRAQLSNQVHNQHQEHPLAWFNAQPKNKQTIQSKYSLNRSEITEHNLAAILAMEERKAQAYAAMKKTHELHEQHVSIEESKGTPQKTIGTILKDEASQILHAYKNHEEENKQKGAFVKPSETNDQEKKKEKRKGQDEGALETMVQQSQRMSEENTNSIQPYKTSKEEWSWEKQEQQEMQNFYNTPYLFMYYQTRKQRKKQTHKNKDEETTQQAYQPKDQRFASFFDTTKETDTPLQDKKAKKTVANDESQSNNIEGNEPRSPLKTKRWESTNHHKFRTYIGNGVYYYHIPNTRISYYMLRFQEYLERKRQEAYRARKYSFL